MGVTDNDIRHAQDVASAALALLLDSATTHEQVTAVGNLAQVMTLLSVRIAETAPYKGTRH
jgi:hypothetical protein